MSEAAADAKRARMMPEDAHDGSPRRIVQALGADETHSMRELFASWGLPARFHEGMAPEWRCRLVPLANDETTQREMACAGVPFLSPVEHARGVFDAMRGEGEKRGGGGGGAEKMTRDGVSWACDAEWNAFARPKVAMIGGWGAPGSHLLSERHMRMVSSFSEVVDSEEPLNLQMFHRGDGSRVPALPEKLKWPLPEFFSAVPHPDAAEAVSELERRRASRTREEETIENAVPLPAQGASRVVGGVGVPLDMATRLSAAGALTWWHLDDCGEFVFQVGLPLDPTLPRRPHAQREPPQMLLGPTGKPVVKLFVFAEKKDYEWIAQDAAMNSSAKQSALDLFDTPSRCIPSEREMEAASGSRTTSAEPPGTETRLPTFWVAPLEAGGPPLLSPPNVIHCVITTRDCVMVEERRLSLAFLDEVEYFRKRAARWCEPPVQYRFVRQDLPDAETCRVFAAMPLAKQLRKIHARLEAFAEPLEASSEEARREARALAATLARFAHSARTLLDGDPAAYALDPATRAWLAREVDECTNGSFSKGNELPRTPSPSPPSLGRVATRDALAADERASSLTTLEDAMVQEGARGAHRIGAVNARLQRAARNVRDGRNAVVTDEDGAPVCAVVHERGRPRWGPARATVEEAVADRKAMRTAIKAGELDDWLRRLREPTTHEGSPPARNRR